MYRQASDDVADTVKAYFESFRARDEEMKSLIGEKLNGKVWTEEDYKKWRLNQIGRGKRFEALRDQLAERMTRANEVAIAYVNDATPSIYSLNRNYSAYTIERVAGDVGFTLWDESTVRRLIVEQPDLMPYYPKARAIKRGIDLAWGKRQITSVVTSGLMRGLGLKGLVDELMQRIPTMNRASAIRSARTAVTGAQNGGRVDSYKAAEKMGIQLQKEWMATLDGRTRHSHRRLDGEVVDNDAKFSNGCRYPGDPRGKPGEVYNCFVGNVKVASDSEVIRSYKHAYHGELITIKTARGVEFTCTPNHPILTPRGWVPAKCLNDGDDILVTCAGRGSASRVYPDVKHTFPTFHAIHEFIYKFGGKRACTLSVNFHGDIPTSDVEIITQKRLLRNNRDSGGGKSIGKFLLELSNKSLMRKGTLVQHFGRICKAPFSLIRRKGKALPLLRRRLSHSNVHGFGSPTDRNAVLPEYPIDNLPAETMLKGELLNRLSGKVFLDHVVDVEVSSSDCHVYNLQTESGYYFVNSSIPQNGELYNGVFAIAKNCRCTITAKVKGIDTSDGKRFSRLGKVSYDDWKKGKKVL